MSSIRFFLSGSLFLAFDPRKKGSGVLDRNPLFFSKTMVGVLLSGWVVVRVCDLLIVTHASSEGFLFFQPSGRIYLNRPFFRRLHNITQVEPEPHS